MSYRDWPTPLPPCPACRAANARPRAVETFSGSLFLELSCDRCGHHWEISRFAEAEAEQPRRTRGLTIGRTNLS